MKPPAPPFDQIGSGGGGGRKISHTPSVTTGRRRGMSAAIKQELTTQSDETTAVNVWWGQPADSFAQGGNGGSGWCSTNYSSYRPAAGSLSIDRKYCTRLMGSRMCNPSLPGLCQVPLLLLLLLLLPLTLGQFHGRALLLSVCSEYELPFFLVCRDDATKVGE